jgi:hypothetical protein
MSSSLAGAGDNATRDPDNRRWWRRVPIRLEAEVVRDSILSVAGQLDPARGGPPVAPEAQAGSRRRSVYFFHSNNERNLFLTTFDGAAVNECYQRDQSIVPQQALALSNSALVQDAADAIAANLSSRTDNGSRRPAPDAAPRAASDDERFIRDAFLSVLGVHPNPGQVSAGADAWNAWRELHEERRGTNAPDPARAHLVWALLNHNDFVTVR